MCGLGWGVLMRGHVKKLLVVSVGVRLVRDALDLELVGSTRVVQ